MLGVSARTGGSTPLLVCVTLVACVISARAQQPPPTSCRLEGQAMSGAVPLPGVSIVVYAASSDPNGASLAALRADGRKPSAAGTSAGQVAPAIGGRATSTTASGRYQLSLPPGAYRLVATLTGFTPVEREVVFGDPSCAQTLDLSLTLAPRRTAATPASPEAPRGTPPDEPSPSAPAERAPANAANERRGARFEQLAVRPDAATTGLEPTVEAGADESSRLMLPPGFSTEMATDAVAVAGEMARVDRGVMNDRLEAIGRGDFDPSNPGLAPGGGFGGPGAFGPGGFAPGAFGTQVTGPVGPPGGGPGSGPGGGGGFFIGGRPGRQDTYSGTANYGYSGSVLDSSPYQLRASDPSEVTPYSRQTFGGTFGGPVRIPGLYNGTRRTSFMFNLNGTRGDELFDQYATVPTEAMRNGDFSSVVEQLVNPRTGEPFAGNQIPASLFDPSSQALLRFIPLPNVSGATRNYHFTDAQRSSSDGVNLRITHNFTPNANPGRPGPRRFGGGAGFPAGGEGARGGGEGQAQPAAQRGTSVMLNAQLQFRRNDNERLNVFSSLGGESRGSSLGVPLSLNIARGRSMHVVAVNLSRTHAETTNRYAFVEDIAGGAGIVGAATDPFDWGVPNLSFAGASGFNDLSPSRRTDRRVSLDYSWFRPVGRHLVRTGVSTRWDQSRNQTDANARGTFVFSGLYTSAAAGAVASGADVADFLLGLPQQASVQYGPGEVALTGRSMALFLQDTWRARGNLTFDLGVRYELVRPFVEQDGQLVNLDVASDFTAVAPVLAGGAGPFTGLFPDASILTDANNLAPRVGVAWRPATGTVLRGGYGIGYNAGQYPTIARQLAGQPPFAVTSTVIGTIADPLAIATALANGSSGETTNNYGVQKDYVLGLVQTWNVDLSRELRRVWSFGVGFAHVKGTHLDIVRAPNRGPDGLRIEGVQPFLWQTSEGSSTMNAVTFRVRRRPVRGIGGGVTYTLGRARDNASSIGGATVVAQNDRDLDAEWGLSSFDRRHQLNANGQVELPFGTERRWLHDGGLWAALFGNWRASAVLTWQSGTPLTPTVRAAVRDVASGVNGTLRADYDGQPIALDDPTADRFFNTSAFSLPVTGLFGTAGRNIIVGPGSKMLNAQLSRDVRMGGNRSLTFQVNATNLLNWVSYATVDTVVNSPTFGQVLAVRPRRTVQVNLRMRF